MAPYISIIIPARNEEKHLNRLLKAVFENITDFDYEVIVVDTESTDNTRAIARRYPVLLTEISSARFSHGRARNLGASNAKGELLVFINADAYPVGKHWLNDIAEIFKDKSVSAVYARQIPSIESSPFEKFFLNYIYPKKAMIRKGIDINNCSLEDIFFSTVNSAIRKIDWQNCKFNEDLILSEDQEWSKRMLLNKKKILYDPEIQVVHSHNYGLKEFIRRNFISGMSLKGVVNASLGRCIGFQARYLTAGIRYMLKHKYFVHTILFPAYEAVRLLAFFIGFHSGYIPLSRPGR